MHSGKVIVIALIILISFKSEKYFREQLEVWLHSITVLHVTLRAYNVNTDNQ